MKSNPFMEVFEKYGYNTQVEIANAVMENDPDNYGRKNQKNVRTYINQIFKFRSPASERIQNLLLNIANDDEALATLFKKRESKWKEKSLEDRALEMFHKRYEQLTESLSQLNSRQILEAYMGFDDYVSKTLERNQEAP